MLKILPIRGPISGAVITPDLGELERIVAREKAALAGKTDPKLDPNAILSEAGDDPRSQVLADAMREKPFDITGRR